MGARDFVHSWKTQKPRAMFNRIDKPSNWELINMRAVVHDDFDVVGRGGLVWDGQRYVYAIGLFEPTHGYVRRLARYDTTKPLGEATSWETFSYAALDADAKPQGGACLHGDYIYYTPLQPYATPWPKLMRLNLSLPFDVNAVELLDISVLAPGVSCTPSAATDGRYLYTPPYAFGGELTRVGMKFDMEAPWDSAASYTVFDLAVIHSDLTAFTGMAYKDGWVYYCPWLYSRSLRYNTELPFDDVESYETIDFSSALGVADLGLFTGMVVAGKYIYYIPCGMSDERGRVLRYNTELPFMSPTAYEHYNMLNISPKYCGFHGAIFDGRYVNFIAYGESGAVYFSGVFVRHDMYKALDDKSAYTEFNAAAAFDDTVRGFAPGTFDGQCVYAVPTGHLDPGGLLLRFHARNYTVPGVGGSPTGSI